MSSLRAAAITLLVLCGASARAVDVKYGVALRSDVRTRTALPGDRGTGVTGDLELDPVLDLALGIDSSAFVFQYAPTLVWREPQAGGRLLPLQRGKVGFTSRWSHGSLLVSEDAAWGLADIGSLRGPDSSLPTTVSEVQTLGGIPYLRSSTAMSFDAQPSSRLSLGAGALFSISGSPEGTVGGLPLQYGPSGSLRARFAASRIDGLTTTLSASSSQFLTGQEQLITQLIESWDRALTRTWNVTAGAGVAFTREVVIPSQGIAGTYLETLPVGSLSTAWKDKLWSQSFGVSGSVRMAPFADRFTGFVYERLEGRLQGDWKPLKELTVMAAGSGALAVPIGNAEQAGDRLLAGEASATWSPLTWLLLQASGRVLWTEQPRLGTPGQVQAVATISVTVREQDSVAW